MENATKGIIGLAGAGVIAAAFFLWNNKKKKAFTLASQAAASQASANARQLELAKMNDPERKAAYDNVYKALVKMYEGELQSQINDKIDGGIRGESGALMLANDHYDDISPIFSNLSVDEINIVLTYLSNGDTAFDSDAFAFRSFKTLATKYPKLFESSPGAYERNINFKPAPAMVSMDYSPIMISG
jgi:hypothetical protein